MQFVLIDGNGHYYSGKSIDKNGDDCYYTSPEINDAVVFDAEYDDGSLIVSPRIPDSGNYKAVAYT